MFSGESKHRRFTTRCKPSIKKRKSRLDFGMKLRSTCTRMLGRKKYGEGKASQKGKPSIWGCPWHCTSEYPLDAIVYCYHNIHQQIMWFLALYCHSIIHKILPSVNFSFDCYTGYTGNFTGMRSFLKPHKTTDGTTGNTTTFYSHQTWASQVSANKCYKLWLCVRKCRGSRRVGSAT